MEKPENTYSNLSGQEKLKAIQNEMAPFFIYAAIPIILTIAITLIFGPTIGV